MNRKKVVKMTVAVAMTFLCFYSGAQQLDINSREIESLIREWNYANNSRSLASFHNVYDDTLIFYTERLPRVKAVALKTKFFNVNPDFRQKITGQIKYTPYTSGVIKCEFEKEVLEKSGWKSYPSYLVVSYEDTRHWIVGESDDITDRRLGYKLDIGEPMQLEGGSDSIDHNNTDTSAHALPTTASVDTSQLDTGWFSVGKPVWSLSSLYTFLSSPEPVSIRRDLIFALVGILLAGGLMIIIADSIRVSRARKLLGRKEPQEPEKKQRDQSEFEAFVVTLFDPLYFKHSRLKREKVLAGNKGIRESEPDLHFHFHYKGIETTFAIQCLYQENENVKEVILFPQERLQQYRHYQEVHEVPVYYVLGFGGAPDDPRELYLVPAAAVRGEIVSKTSLKPFYKSGMFFYNDSIGRLQ